jgi:membrane associated rhomboid family serine protease
MAFWIQMTSPGSITHSVLLYGVIPDEVLHHGAADIAGHVSAPFSLITSLFTHGGFIHLISNMLFLWVFGRNVEDDFGHIGFLAFYLVTGVLASMAFVLAFPASKIPLVGASGAIAGLLGAYFLRFPLSKIYCLFIFIIFVRIIPLPAFILLGIWFMIQFLSCVSDCVVGAAGQGGVAFLSHITGFVAGIVWTLMILRKRYHERYAR